MSSKSSFAREKHWLLREKYAGKEDQRYFDDVKRLSSGEPLDYVIGYSHFLRCKIDLSFRPFIPRPETEWWVENEIRKLKSKSKKNFEILDAFAGSGCIGIAILKHAPNATVHFIEKNPDFIKQIKKNIALNKISKKRYKIFHRDLKKDNLPIKKYDHIFSNPPYIPFSKKTGVASSVLRFEPKDALFAADNGLFYIKRLVDDARMRLSPGWTLVFEFDSRTKKELENILKKKKKNGLISSFSFSKDQYNRWRTAEISYTI